MWELCLFLLFPELTLLTLGDGFSFCLPAVKFCKFLVLNLFYGSLQLNKRQHKHVLKHISDGGDLALVY